MKRILLASVLTLACFGTSIPAIAHGHGHHRGNCQGKGNCGNATAQKQRGKNNQCKGNCAQQQQGAQKGNQQRNQQGQQK